MENQVQSLSHAAVSPLASLLGHLLLERATFRRSSSFLRHVPFLFWLIETARPASVVEIGVQDGVSHFAACQAVERLGLDAICYGVGFWAESGIPLELHEYEIEHYPDLSRLSCVSPLQAVQSLSAGSIDLLVISAPTSGDLLDCLDEWLAKLSPVAIVLLSGTGAGSEGSPERSLHERVVLGKPTITLDTDQGVTAVLWGLNCEETLIEASSLRFGTQMHRIFYRIFTRLGMAQQAEWLAQSRAAELERAHKRLALSEQSLEQSTEQGAVLTEELRKLHEAYQSRSGQAAVSQAKLFDQQVALETCVEERDQLNRELDQSRLILASQSLEAETSQARMNLRFEEIATLTRIVEQKNSDLQKNTKFGLWPSGTNRRFG